MLPKLTIIPDETADENKGDPIKFVSGIYKGRKGWVNKTKGKTTKEIYVIVAEDEKMGLLTKATRVRQSSVEPINNEEPRSYEEAVLQQHPDVDEAMSKLALLMVQCRITPEYSTDEIHCLMKEKLEKAWIDYGKLGHKAKFRSTSWNEKTDDIDHSFD